MALQPVILRDGAGTATFSITNAGTTSVPLALRVSAFTDDTSQAPVAPPKVTFAWDTGAPLPATIGPGATLRIESTVTGLSRATLASAPLFNGAVLLGRLQTVQVDAPLDITIGGSAAADPASDPPGDSSAGTLVLANGQDATYTLTNNDDQSYPIDWAFQIGGRTLQSGELQLAPHGRSQIEMTPTSDLYSWRDDLRPSTRTGTLLLALHGPPTVPRDLLPQRTLRVSLLMRKLSPASTSLWLHITVALILLLGGLLSLIGNSVLPNIFRKISVRRQLHPLADRVGSVSTRVDPYLRTLLRMERKRIDLLLRRSWAISPGVGEQFESLTTAIDRLRKRLKITERLDELRRRLEQDATVSPPSAIDDIDGKLRMAENQLRSFSLTDEDINVAGRFLDAAEGSLAMLGDSAALAQMTAANFSELKVRQKLLAFSYYNDLYTALPGLFEMLNQPFEEPRNITRHMLFAIDYGIASLNLAFDFAILRVSASAAVPSGDAGTGPGSRQSPRERLVARQAELIHLLGTLSWPALRELRALVQEMRENIYESDVLEEIAAVGQAEIVFEPRAMKAYTPAVFHIRFRDARFNDAAATRRLSWIWDFPGHPMEQGWKICHFFRGNEGNREDGKDLTVSVRVESPKPAEVPASAGKLAPRLLRNTLSTRFELQHAEGASYSGAFAETVRFLIAFGVALAALFSGALQQLNRLDLIPAMVAVLALGFGADTIKNLLVQTSKKVAI